MPNGVSLESIKQLVAPTGNSGRMLVENTALRSGMEFSAMTSAILASGDFSATGGAGQILRQQAVGVFSVGMPLFNVRTVTDAAATLAATDQVLAMAGVTAPRAIALPAASSVAGQVFIIKDATGNAATHNLTINRAGSDTIDGATSLVISANYGVARLYSTGTHWFVF